MQTDEAQLFSLNSSEVNVGINLIVTEKMEFFYRFPDDNIHIKCNPNVVESHYDMKINQSVVHNALDHFCKANDHVSCIGIRVFTRYLLGVRLYLNCCSRTYHLMLSVLWNTDLLEKDRWKKRYNFEGLFFFFFPF